MAHTIIHRLDLNDFTSGNTEKKTAFVSGIGKAFNETGFVTIANHGLSKELIAELYVEVKKLFDLPENEKKKYEILELAGQRGYTSKGREKAKDSTTPDLKEFWQIGQFIEDASISKLEYPDNILIKESERFNIITKDVYKKLESAGKELLRAIAIYLELDENYFDDKIYNGNSILRAIHYFPIDNPESLPKDAVRAGAHEDINLITLLIGASAEGLELLTRDGEWYPVKADINDIVVNVGDMLQRLTNNKLKSTTHRVVNPPVKEMKNSRYSVPFFLHPVSDMSLASLESCISESSPKAYEDYTAGQYLDERLKEIGLKKN